MWNRFAPRLRQTIFKSVEDCARRGAPEVTADDLLTSSLRDPDSAAAIVLDRCGTSFDALRSKARDVPAVDPSSVLLSHCAMGLLQRATEEAEQRGDTQVGTEHVLLAAVRDGERTGNRLSVSVSDVESHLDAWRADGMPRPSMRIHLPAARTLAGRVRRIGRLIKIGFGAYVQSSLAHPGFVTDPYPLYANLRRRESVRRDPLLPAWVITGYEEVVTTLRDPRFRKELYLSDSMSDALRRQFGLPEQRDAGVEGEPMAMLFLDPPRHTKYRGLFNKAFTPQALQRLRPRVQQITDECFDAIARRDDGRMDVIADLAYPLPTLVIAELLGFPLQDYEKLKKWSDDFAAALTINPTVEQQARSNQSREEMREYFNAMIDRLRLNSSLRGNNLISTLLAEGCDGDRLTRQEFFANCALLVAAGHETTTNLIGNGVLALLRHPDQLRLLRDDPSLIRSAVEELLRFDSPVQWTARVVSEDLDLGGKQIRRGEVLLSSLGAANRDPRHFFDPERLDIRRSDNRHVAFGQGIHFCLGASLARMEAEIAIGTLVSRFAEIRLQSQRLQWNQGLIFRGVKSLRVGLAT